MESDTMALEEFPDSDAIAVTDDPSDKTAQDLAPVFDVPVNISAVLGKAHMSVPSTSSSTTGWSPAARSSSSRTGSA